VRATPSKRDGVGRSIWAVAAGTCALVFLAACGNSEDLREARLAASGLYSAVEAKQGAAACRRLSQAARKALEEQERRACPEAVVELEVSGPRVLSVSVFETSAAARMAGGDTVFLDETAGGWRVSAAGCRPAGSERPYDCELES
jgi:hypothetical protein